MLHHRRQRLARLDDMRRQHAPGLGAEVARIVRRVRRDQEFDPRRDLRLHLCRRKAKLDRSTRELQLPPFGDRLRLGFLGLLN